MKVFICWSGARSQAIGHAVKSLLAYTVPTAEVFISADDIESGALWRQVLSEELAATNFGIVCMTPENRGNKWVHFEAGAISKAFGEANVVPLVYGMSKSDVSGPLTAFQMRSLEQAEMTRLIVDMNAKAGDLKPMVVQRLLEATWPEFEAAISSIEPTAEQPQPTRTDRALLEDLVDSVRFLQRRSSRGGPWSSTGSATPTRYEIPTRWVAPSEALDRSIEVFEVSFGVSCRVEMWPVEEGDDEPILVVEGSAFAVGRVKSSIFGTMGANV